eukprot:1159895-Pelagomonas_calceolata.AAC.8
MFFPQCIPNEQGAYLYAYRVQGLRVCFQAMRQPQVVSPLTPGTIWPSLALTVIIPNYAPLHLSSPLVKCAERPDVSMPGRVARATQHKSHPSRCLNPRNISGGLQGSHSTKAIY